MNKVKGFFALFSAGVILGSFGIWIRLLDKDLGPFQQIILRNLIALIFSLLIIVILRRSFSLNKVSKKYLLLYTFSFPAAIVLFTLAVLKTKITTAIFGLYTASLLFSLIVGPLVFSEKITLKKIAALFLVFSALIIYTWPISPENLLNPGFILGLGAGFAEATANSFRKYLGSKIDKFILVALQGLGALILGFALSFITGSLGVPSISVSSWLILFIFGSLLIAMSYLTLVGFSNFELNLGTVVVSSELFFGPLFAALIFSEFPTYTQITGGILILIAIIVLHVNFNSEQICLIKNL